MRRLAIVCALAVVPACTAAPEPPGPVELAHTFPTITLAGGEERANLCQSWTLDNTTPLDISQVVFDAGPAWHHSNWFFVPDDQFTGADGIWPCADRGFDESMGALAGGVLYAQSTQVTHEVQAFPDGAVVVVPRHSRVIGETHALNAGTASVTTSMSLTLTSVPADTVTTRLHGLALQYRPLDLPPQSTSSFTSTCDFSTALGHPPTFSIDYVLAHYHTLGTGMTLEAIRGGTADPVFSTGATIGNPLGGTLDPPYAMDGATALRFTCTYDNPRTDHVYWGIGDQEMCVLLAFTDDGMNWVGGALDTGAETGVAADGTIENSGPCRLIALPPHD